MHYDREEYENLLDLVEILGGVNLPVIDCSEELMNEIRESYRELVNVYETSSAILNEIKIWYTWFLALPLIERRQIVHDATWECNDKLNILTWCENRYNSSVGGLADNFEQLFDNAMRCWD